MLRTRTLLFNVGYADFVDNDPSKWRLLSGYALSGGYRTPVGPVEISLMYSDQAKSFFGICECGVYVLKKLQVTCYKMQVGPECLARIVPFEKKVRFPFTESLS